MRYTLAAIDIGQYLSRILDSIIRIAPRVLFFIVILVIGWVIARIIDRAVAAILHRVHFDRVAGRGVVGDALRRSDYDASRLIARIAYYVVLLITLQWAFSVFGPNPVSDLLRTIVAWLPRAVVAVIILVIASAIAHAVQDVLRAALSGLPYGRFIAAATAIFILVIGVIAALNQVGIATTVTEPVLITVLATVGAILAIGVGGGLVRPMQQRWERMLSVAERDMTSLRGGSYERGREDALRGPGVPAEQGPTPPHATRTGAPETPGGTTETPRPPETPPR
ncbi:mechanosensitive ion channel family protein [Actinomadura scrupuli]|uniref:mechanosensitive ion channel family protein n=1 Tax=Actinomadura scrupuli TaxID=559629 RepID=UPI003D990490